MIPTLLMLACALPAAPVVLDAETKGKLQQIAFQAAREGDVKTLAAYFAAGLPVNVENDRGDSLLILATYHGNAAAARLVLKQPGVNVSFRNRMGFTALDGAAFKGHTDILRALIKAGADVNARTASGRTALMLAALTGRTEAVDELLKAGADVSAADRKGTTALGVARAQGAEDVVKLLETARRP